MLKKDISGLEEIQKELKKRNLPDFLVLDGREITDAEQWEQNRAQMQSTICRELYGFMSFRDCSVSGETVKFAEDGYGGKAVIETVLIRVSTVRGVCCFPVRLAIPKEVQKPAVFLNMTGFPGTEIVEELIDCHYAAVTVFYQDIMPDRPEAEMEGVGGLCEKTPYIGWGKIAMWAYGISRVTDYLMTRQDIDTGRIAVVGHSRLGKAALLSAALDPRCSLVISAGSGAGGAALFRGKTGERIENLSKHWFCGNMQKYAFHPELLPFDQHFLLALAAPRRVYISSASEDDWADPRSEFLSCAAATPAYEFLGLDGLVCRGYPKVGEVLQEGHIAYHMRKGTHALTREDWHCYMRYRQRYHV